MCSGSLWQIGHRSDPSKHLFFLLGHVGSEFVATRHAKNLTVGGTFVFHIKSQHLLVPSGEELDADSDDLTDYQKETYRPIVPRKVLDAPDPKQ